MKMILASLLLMVVWLGGQGNQTGQSGQSGQGKDELKAMLDREMQRSRPDYVVYRPGSVDGSTFDNGNEHFLVFDGPDGSLMAVWTQSSYETGGDHRMVFARSDDEGKTWTPPLWLVGPRKPGDGHIASWGFPLVSKRGRIYVVYNQYHGIDDVMPQFTDQRLHVVQRVGRRRRDLVNAAPAAAARSRPADPASDLLHADL